MNLKKKKTPEYLKYLRNPLPFVVTNKGSVKARFSKETENEIRPKASWEKKNKKKGTVKGIFNMNDF